MEGGREREGGREGEREGKKERRRRRERKCEHLIFRRLKHVGVAGCG